MMKFTSAITILLIFASFCPTNEVTDAIKYKMFCCACQKGGSTSQNYVVVKVKNLKTGELKDICVTLNLLEGAIWREKGRCAGLKLRDENVSAQWTIIAAGCFSANIEGVAAYAPVRPAKGQMVSMRADELKIERVLSMTIQRPSHGPVVQGAWLSPSTGLRSVM